MSKHKSLDDSLRATLQGLEGATRREALGILEGIPIEDAPLDFWTALQFLSDEDRHIALAILGAGSVEDYYASVREMFAETREIQRESAGRPARESLTHTEQFAAVTA